MKTTLPRPRYRSAAFLALLLPALAGPEALAQLNLHATVTPKAGSFRYDITIENLDPVEYVLVTLLDAPMEDPLIDPSLLTPDGFLASYDSALGFVDFLADLDSFLPGSFITGFQFDSLSDPGSYFSQLEAMDVEGNLVPGNVSITLVPEAGTQGAAALLVLGAAHLALRRRNHSTTLLLQS